ncbi:MAG: lysophospholipid acyltransferase family protein [Candidatus Riflebacteria bacterium]|nr:lysophospholipid acyltransferase family protein [Candidatus Riflebacteria bacterium]
MTPPPGQAGAITGRASLPSPPDREPDADRPRDVEIPRARPPWITRLIGRLSDVIVVPALIGLRAVLAMVRREPAMRWAERLGALLARVLPLTTFRRNLRAIAGRDSPAAPADQVRCVVVRSTVHQLQHVVDIVKVLDQRAVPLPELVICAGEEHLDRALSQGRGVVLLAAHLGNWEITAAWIGSRGHKLSVLYFEQLSPALDRYLNRVRQSFGVGMLHQRRGLKSAVRALGRNELVGFVTDQDGTASGVFTDFFGLLVSAPRGAARVAMRYRCPLVHVWNLRLPDGRYRLTFEEPIDPPDRSGEEEERSLTGRILRGFEETIRSDPSQWLLSYDRFKLRHVDRLKELGLIDRALREQLWLQRDRPDAS